MTLEDLIKELVDAGSNIAQYYTGTQAEYNALEEKDDGSIYFITDTHLIYKGNTCFSGVREITVITENPTGAEGDSGYDKRKEQHVIIITNHNGEKVAVTLKTVGAIDEMYRDLQDHKRTKASDNVLAHVVLSDDIASQLDVNSGTAATPKSVYDALEEAKKYAEETMAVQGSFEVLKGYVTQNGIIESAEDTSINGVNINSLTNYKKGWAFFVRAVGVYVGENCEVNDKIICMNDYVNEHKASDFIVLQANVDGAVTTTEQLRDNTVILGADGHSVKPLANGSNGQVFTMKDDKPQWADNVDTDTTYMFTDGTDGSFNVTPKDGQPQKVKIGKPDNAGHADTSTKATHATNADNATRANLAVKANHALKSDEATHSETADLADNLGGKPETHEENFVYQPTAADLSIKDGFAEIKKLKGNTLVWNQLIQNGNFIDGIKIWQTSSVETYLIEQNIIKFVPSAQFGGPIQLIPSIKKHKYLVYADVYQSDSSFGAYIKGHLGNKNVVIRHNTTSWQRLNAVIDVTKDGNGSIGIGSLNTENFGEIQATNFQLIDLTQMFGEGNEPATVEEFEAMFPDDYYEYNEGELMSFDGKGLKSVGFNQWDEEWELGDINATTGTLTTNSTTIRSKNYIKALPNTKYFIKKDFDEYVFFYKSDYSFIVSKWVSANSTFTTPSNCCYIMFRCPTSYGVTYKNNICINLSHSGYRDGKYEPYEDYTLSFQDGKTISQLTGKLNGEGDSVVIFPDGLRSAGEAFDEIVYDESTGKHKAIKRIGNVNMDTLNWEYSDKNVSQYYPLGFFKARLRIKSNENLVSVKYPVRSTNANQDYCMIGNEAGGQLYLIDTSFNGDTDSIKASLQGQILYYELAEPEVYTLDNPINTSYEAYDFGTEEIIYSEDSEVNIPMKADIEYGFNAVDMIRSNYFDIQKLKKKAITTDGGAIEGDLSVDNLTAKTINASESITAQTFVGDLEGKAKNADTVTQSTTNETGAPILVHGRGDTVTYNPNFTLNKFNEYLPLAGGTMSGNIDMGGNEIKNTNFELVESLPTENLYEGRQVTYNGRVYTYHNGKWISTADDLGDLKETLSSEFVFRPTADTHSVKDEFAFIKSVKGNTVVWNQLIKSLYAAPEICSLDNTVTTEKKYIINPGSHSPSNHILYVNEGTNRESTHKLLLKLKYKTNFTDTLSFRYQCYDGTYNSVLLSYTKDKWSDNSFILTQGWKYGFSSGFLVVGSYVEGEYLSIPNEGGIQLFDLTQMFGEGNEPATVEEFEKLYSHLPADYNEGSLLNLNADSIKSVGFNQWDEEWENGEFTWEGNIASNPNRIVSSFIKVIPSKEYFYRINQPTSIASDAAFYDENKNRVHYTTRFYINSEFTIPNNVHYIRICPSSIYGNTYNNDICINLSHNGEKDGEYQSYEEHTVNLPIKKYFPDGLKSAGSAYDEIVFDKNIGKYKAIQRIGSVDMRTLTWRANVYNGFGTTSLNNKAKFREGKEYTELPSLLTTKYPTHTTHQGDSNNIITSIPLGWDSTGYIVIKDSSYTDVATFKESLQGQILYYELAEPIETIIEDYDLIAYKANDWGTEEIISEELTTPIKADIEYNFDAVEMVRDNYFEVVKIKKDYLPIDGTAVSADKLTTARMIKIKGAVESDSPRFDGTQDIEIDTTVIGSKINWGEDINITDKNLVTSIENNRNPYKIDITGRAGTAGYAESITSVSELSVDNPSTANIPNEKAVTDAVMTLVNLLTWKTIGGNE